MKSKPLQHFLSFDQLDTALLTELLDHAQNFMDPAFRSETVLPNLSGKIVAHLFFENSTRTRNSFELAAKRLGAIVLSPNLDSSSLSKGETFLDTVLNLEALGVSAFVIRHPQENFFNELINHLKPSTHLINAGDGSHEHPSQTLLDLLTIRQHKADFKKSRVAIVGDIIHSRVVPSLLKGLKLLGISDIRLVGPENLLPKEAPQPSIRLFNSMQEGLVDADVIVTLRLQKERMGSNLLPLLDHFAEDYCLNIERLALAKPDAIVMHPGPLNREVEITAEVADGPQSVILKQVSNGLVARMAILDYLLTN